MEQFERDNLILDQLRFNTETANLKWEAIKGGFKAQTAKATIELVVMPNGRVDKVVMIANPDNPDDKASQHTIDYHVSWATHDRLTKLRSAVTYQIELREKQEVFTHLEEVFGIVKF